MIRTIHVVLQALPGLAAAMAASALAATATPPTVDFGGQSMNTTSLAQVVTFTNDGGASVLVSNVTVSSTQFAQTHNCGTVVAGGSCSIFVVFKPAVAPGPLNAAVAVNGTLTIVHNGAGGSNVVNLAGTAEKSLVTHYYRSILRRSPDTGGKAFWEGEAARMESIGVNVNEAWFSLAMQFFGSPEYLALGRNNNDYVTDLYVTFFNRSPDSGGLSYWSGQLAQGMPRDVALVSFMLSAEFASFTTAIFGNNPVRAEIDVVVDFFRGILGRLPDNGGFVFWRDQFRAAQCQAASAVSAQAESISNAFVTSAEYTARNRTHSQYVADLYNAFLRRGGDLAGVQYWINQLTSGAQTRSQVRQQFVASAEFSGRVQAVIAQGCFNPTPSCSDANVLCVGGPNSEYSTIQAAITAANPAAGKTVLVFDGNHAGFRIPSNRSGLASSRFTVKAAGTNAVITAVNTQNEGITISNADYVTVEGFRMSNMPAFGLACHDAPPTDPMIGVIIRNNTVTDSGSVNIYCSNAAFSLIEGNLTSGSKSSHGIYLANGGSDNTTVRGNVSFNNAKTGLHLNGDLSIGGDGLHQGVIIEDNLFYDNAMNAMDLDGLHDSTIRNNVMWGNGTNGIRVFRIDAAAGAGNLRVMNNTVIVPSGGSAALKFTADIGGHTIFNNVFINLGTQGTIVVGNTNFKSNHNIVVNSGFSVNEGSTMMNFTAWKALAGGYDANSIVSSSSALFVNPASNDYRLKAGAPAANAGVATFNGIAAPADDIAGVARPQGGAYDMGAYESF